MRDPFYDYDADDEEIEYEDQELEEDWCEANDAEYARIADIYERGIYGD